MDVVECKTEEEFKEMFLVLLTNHAYPKLIPSLTEEGERIPIGHINWSLTIAEEQGFAPVLVTNTGTSSYFAAFAPTTQLTGYIPLKPLNC